MKKLRLRFEVTWCWGDFGGKTPTNYFLQGLPSGDFGLPVKQNMSQV